MNWFLNNRQVIRSLAINTGTTSVPVYTNLCVASEIGIMTDLETQDFYVFCDALKRYLTTGADVGFSATIKMDIQNAGVQELLSKVHTLISTGAISQFSNVMIQFELLTGVSSDTLTYEQYDATANLTISDLGGAAEDASEFSIELKLNGPATASASV
jgi:hypothetical protein